MFFSLKDHPLTEKLKAYQFKIYERIYPLVCDKLEGLRHVTVPLNKSLWPPESKVKDTFEKGKKNKKSHEKLEKEERNYSSGVINLRKKESESSINEGSNHSSCECRTMEEITENVRDDLETAVEMGDKLQHKLEEENERVGKMAQRLSFDVETYHAENMDDLFDEEGEEGEDKTEGEKISELQDKSITTENNSSGEESEFSKERSDSTQSLEDPEEIERLRIEAHKRHVKGISEDVHLYLDKLQEMFICVYEQLDSPEGRDSCYSQLEEPFFKPIWQYLLALYRYYVSITHEYSVHYTKYAMSRNPCKFDFLLHNHPVKISTILIYIYEVLLFVKIHVVLDKVFSLVYFVSVSLLFSSPELKDQLNFSDHILFVHLSIRKLFTFSTFSPEPLGQF